MTDAQKLIKYFAIGFAFLLIMAILCGIGTGITSLLTFFNPSDAIMEEFEKATIDGTIENLKIDISASKLTIKESTLFEVETNNKYVDIDQDHNDLIIKEEKHTFITHNNKSEIIIYIPKEYSFKLFELDAGAGNIKISNINASKVNFDLGAGNLVVNSINVGESIDLDLGAGNLEFKNANLSNLDLDLGVGNFSFDGFMIGTTEIDAGVGTININLNGNKENYKIICNKGIGSTKINGKSINNDTTYGTGSNLLTIDGGVGSIDILLKEDK